VTHELRTPLTSIRMYAEMLEGDMISSSDKRRQYHHTIRGEAERLGRLVEQVLTLARLERRGETPQGARAPLGETLTELERPTRVVPVVPDRGVRVQPPGERARDILPLGSDVPEQHAEGNQDRQAGQHQRNGLDQGFG